MKTNLISLYLIEEKAYYFNGYRPDFYDKCVEALAVLDDLSLEMGDVTNLEKGHIRVGISAIMNVRLLQKV